MTNDESLYNNVERKRDLVNRLKEQETFVLQAADALDKKAWDILSVTSATFAIVAAIEINLISEKNPPAFWVGLGVVLVLYFLQVREVLAVVNPRVWAIVPGANENTRYETIMNKYVASKNEVITEDEYLNQLIADYVGNVDINNSGVIIPGSIQQIEAHNQDKARHIRNAARLLSIIVASLLGLSYFALSIS